MTTITTIRDNVDLRTHVSRLMSGLPHLDRVARVMGWNANAAISQAMGELDMMFRSFFSDSEAYQRADGSKQEQGPKEFLDFVKWTMRSSTAVEDMEKTYLYYSTIKAMEVEFHWTEDPELMACMKSLADAESARQAEFAKIKTLVFIEFGGEITFRINWDEDGTSRKRHQNDHDCKDWLLKVAPKAQMVIVRSEDPLPLTMAFAAHSNRIITDSSYYREANDPGYDQLFDLALMVVANTTPACLYLLTTAYDDPRSDTQVALEGYTILVNEKKV